MKSLIPTLLILTLSGCASLNRMLNEPQIATGRTYTQCYHSKDGQSTTCYERQSYRPMTPEERERYNAIHGTDW